MRIRAFVAAAIVAAGSGALARSTERVAEAGDAFVEADRDAGRWTIGTQAIELALLTTRAGELRLDGLRWPGGPNLSRASHADGLVTADGRSGALGEATSGFRVTTVEAAVGDGFVEARVALAQERGPLLATRHYRARPGAAAIEVWTEFRVGADAHASVQDLNAVAVDVPAGRIHWVTGLDAGDGPFTRQSRDLSAGESVTLGSPVVSSSDVVPWLAIAGPEGTVFAALAWSGTWSVSLDREEERLVLRMGLPGMSATVSPDEPVEGPHALLGVVSGDAHAASAAAQRALVAGRAPLPSWSTFNSWFVYGVQINEANMTDAIEQASRAGIELFQLDAGWYPRQRPASIWDFTNGLGSWEVDRTRFPQGLGPIGDLARARGMRFGVWVEPERVALSTVGQPGLARERFLATSGGSYDAGRRADDTLDGQICLGDREAREWLLAQLTAFIEQARPDYLKWDYNRWLICDRPDHGHAVDGGSFAHVRGLYALLDALRARFPSLLIENCSGGGHRLDAGLFGRTDAGWMDDRSAPSSRVRHNLEGLTALFPAGYLLSYVMPHESEPMDGAADMSALARSRMVGTLGVAVDFHAIGERDINGLAQEARLARALRGYQADAVTYLLSEQAQRRPAFEILQQWSAQHQRGVLWVFQNDTEQMRTIARLRGLEPDRMYELRHVDSNRVERLSGATLMDAGVEVRATQETTAQILTIDAVGTAPVRLR